MATRRRDLHSGNRSHPKPVPWRPPTPEREHGAHGRGRALDVARALVGMRGPFSERAAREHRVNACRGFAPFDARRKRWARERVSELAGTYGDLSRGVGARVHSAAWGFAFGEWAASRAAECGDVALADVALRILARASDEDDKARDLAARERHERRSQPTGLTLAEALAAET